MQRFHHFAVQHDALDAAPLAFAERAFRGDADLLHPGWRGVALMRATSSAIWLELRQHHRGIDRQEQKAVVLHSPRGNAAPASKPSAWIANDSP